MARNATGSRPTLKLVEFEAGSNKDAMKEAGATARSVYQVPIAYIQTAPGFNVRVTDSAEYQEKLDELKRSILQHGFYQTKPLAGYVAKASDGSNVLYVIDGHRRLEAARLAVAEGLELEKLPVILKDAKTASADLAVSMHRENTGEPLSMLEKAVLVKRLMTNGMSEVEVAQELGMTERYVSDLLVLVAAPKQVRQIVSEGLVSGTEAVKQLRKHKGDSSAAVAKLSEAVEKAEAKGKKRATAADTGPTGEASVKMETVVIRHALEVGNTMPWREAQQLVPFFGDDGWFALTENEEEVRATEPVEVTIRVRRPKREDGEAAEQPAEPKRRGRPRKPVEADQPIGREVDPLTMQDVGGEEEAEEPELEGAANLEELGIADPASGL